MKIIIDTMQCPCRTLNDECGISGQECYEDDICSTCPLIRNGGIELPKGYERIIEDKIKVLNKIRTEIEKWHKEGTNWSDMRLMKIEDILDKYKEESE